MTTSYLDIMLRTVMTIEVFKTFSGNFPMFCIWVEDLSE